MMKTKFLGLGLAALNLSLLAVVAAPGLTATAYAQEGTNKGLVKRTNKSVACPSGWRTVSEDTDYCEPQGSLAPKIYAKDDSESCVDGYYEVYRYWCSTKRP